MSDDKKREEIPAEKLAELEKEHGEILPVKTSLGPVAFRMPKRAEYQLFQASALNASKRQYAGENMIVQCVVHPDQKTFNGMLDRRPFLITKLSNKLVAWAGEDDEDDEKKD